jgi:MFS family permease
MLVAACGHFNRVGISVAGAERMIPDQGISPEKMGMIYSAFLLAYTAAMIPGGILIDRLGARAVLVLWGLGSAVFVVCSGAVGLSAQEASGLWLGLMIVRSLLGVVNAPLHPAAARMVFERVPAGSRALANGLVTGAACVGIASTYYGMGILIDRFDWPGAFLISGGFTFLVTLIWSFGSRTDEDAARPNGQARDVATVDLSAIGEVARNRSVVYLTLSYVAFGYFQYLFFYWITYYFETIQHQHRSVARGYSTMITLAMGAGMVGGGWLADHSPSSLPPRARRAFVPVLGMVLSGLVFELGLLAPNPKVTMAAFAFAAAAVGMCEGVFWTTSNELGGRYGGTAGGLMNTGGNIGGTLSPYLTPLLGTLFEAHYGPDLGWRLSLASAGIVVMIGAALWWGVDGPIEAAPNPPADDDRAEVGSLGPLAPDYL